MLHLCYYAACSLVKSAQRCLCQSVSQALTTLLGLFFCASLSAQNTSDLFASYLRGEWDNFQQCWLENTETESHRIATAYPHRHLHSVFTPDSSTGLSQWRVEHYEGRQQRLLARYTMHLSEHSNGQLQTDFWPATPDSSPDARPFSIRWTLANGIFLGQQKQRHSLYVLKKDTLLLLDEDLFQQPDSTPYRLLKCRFFRGWIQYPMEHIHKDSVYFYSGLTLHDQGGTAQLQFSDKTLGEYTVELTQLVHSRRTPILKLAIYTEPPEQLHWNSRAVAYSWADPAARRIGVNIRKVVSGWTLISEP